MSDTRDGSANFLQLFNIGTRRYWRVHVLAINLRAAIELSSRDYGVAKRDDVTHLRDRWPNEREPSTNEARHCFYSFISHAPRALVAFN